MIETVRIIVIYGNKVLLLQKSEDSKNPNMFEFPGGKIENEPEKSAIRELFEETSIKIKKSQLNKLDFFKTYTFEYNGSEVSRRVNYFYVKLNYEPNVQINMTLNDLGELEDKHVRYRWVELDELADLQNLAENSKLDINLLQKLL